MFYLVQVSKVSLTILSKYNVSVFVQLEPRIDRQTKRMYNFEIPSHYRFWDREDSPGVEETRTKTERSC